MKFNRVLLVTLALGAIAVNAFAFFERRVTVESEDGRYRSRSVDTRGGVRLVRRLSDAPCVYGRSWGFDRNRIWVDNGCRATFEVGSGNGNWDDSRDWNRDRDRDRDWRDRDRDRDRDRRDDCPTWLPGRYNGYEDGNRVFFQIDLGGGVTFRRDRGGRWDNDERGYYRDNCIYVGNRVYEVSRYDGGIRMRNRDHRFDLRRQ